MISKAILAVILYVREVFLGYRYPQVENRCDTLDARPLP